MAKKRKNIMPLIAGAAAIGYSVYSMRERGAMGGVKSRRGK